MCFVLVFVWVGMRGFDLHRVSVGRVAGFGWAASPSCMQCIKRTLVPLLVRAGIGPLFPPILRRALPHRQRHDARLLLMID